MGLSTRVQDRKMK